MKETHRAVLWAIRTAVAEWGTLVAQLDGYHLQVLTWALAWQAAYYWCVCALSAPTLPRARRMFRSDKVQLELRLYAARLARKVLA